MSFTQDEDDERESKSARKRSAHAAQKLGEDLVALSDAELEALGLPERLADAVRAARAIRSRGALARQRQFIGRLMRDIDTAAIISALAARENRSAAQSRQFHQLESWRDRLIEAPGALEELLRRHPSIDQSEWQRAIDAARAERNASATAAGAGRTLFRMLRALIAPEPAP